MTLTLYFDGIAIELEDARLALGDHAGECSHFTPDISNGFTGTFRIIGRNDLFEALFAAYAESPAPHAQEYHAVVNPASLRELLAIEPFRKIDTRPYYRRFERKRWPR